MKELLVGLAMAAAAAIAVPTLAQTTDAVSPATQQISHAGPHASE